MCKKISDATVVLFSIFLVFNLPAVLLHSEKLNISVANAIQKKLSNFTKSHIKHEQSMRFTRDTRLQTFDIKHQNRLA